MRKWLIALLVLWILTVFTGLAVFIIPKYGSLHFLKKKHVTPAVKVATGSAVATESAQATTSASASAQTGNNLTVQVLNATGKPGLAAKVKEQLVALNFRSIETGNAKSAASSSIEAKKTVPKKTLDEVIMTLGDSYGTIAESVASESAKFDIIITLGQ